MPKWSGVKVSLQLPQIARIEGTWEPDKQERAAAWEMYVELATRISIAELSPEEGLLREALSSLHSLFGTTREILRKYGPGVAGRQIEDAEGPLIVGQPGQLSFGHLAVAILNAVLRPTLAKWHPRLLAYENTREPGISPVEHERQWPESEELRQALNEVRDFLITYADLLAQAARVPSLLVQREDR